MPPVLIKRGYLLCDGQGHGQQSLAPCHDLRTSEHHPRREDDHLEWCHNPRGPKARRSRTRRGYIFRPLLSCRRGMRHEVSLIPVPSVESPNHPSDASWLVQAALQDLSRHIQLLSDENRRLCPYWCQHHHRSGDHWQSC